MDYTCAALRDEEMHRTTRGHASAERERSNKIAPLPNPIVLQICKFLNLC